MGVITLTSDLGLKDYYVAAVKGTILSQLENVNIIDVTHSIHPFDIREAAFVVKNAYRDFPLGSVHIVGVNPELVLDPQDERRDVYHIAFEYDGHFFIGADNGMFSLMFGYEIQEVFVLNFPQDSDDITFPTKNIFAKAACHILRGGTLEVIGKRRNGIRQAVQLQPTLEMDVIKGSVIYIDGYDNIITNITKELFEKQRRDRKYSIYLRRESYEINEIHTHYNAVDEGEMVAIFSNTGYLEIAVNKGAVGSGGGAKTLFGLNINDVVRIEFKNPPRTLTEL